MKVVSNYQSCEAIVYKLQKFYMVHTCMPDTHIHGKWWVTFLMGSFFFPIFFYELVQNSSAHRTLQSLRSGKQWPNFIYFFPQTHLANLSSKLQPPPEPIIFGKCETMAFGHVGTHEGIWTLDLVTCKSTLTI